MTDGLAVFACTMFTGASIYISLVEHPARLSCSTEVAATQWAPSYKRATVMQVSLAVTAAICGAITWWQRDDALWLVGAVLIISVIPFTALVILPTNNRLLTAGRDLASDETRMLLEKWGRLHAVRSTVSLAASVVYIWALTAAGR